MSPFFSLRCFISIYILFSKSTDRYYIGHTSDVNRRLEEHNHPEELSKYTEKGILWNLILSFDISHSRGEARKVEKFIKMQKSRSSFLKLIREKDNRDYLEDLIKSILK